MSDVRGKAKWLSKVIGGLSGALASFFIVASIRARGFYDQCVRIPFQVFLLTSHICNKKAIGTRKKKQMESGDCQRGSVGVRAILDGRRLK